jgi:hypothetical protein
MKKIFISYKRNIDPDEQVALQLFEALRLHHHVFIDQTTMVGTDWTKKIHEEIQKSDVFITLLSTASVQSEMVIGEIELAYQRNKQTGNPLILPIRLNFTDPLEYRLMDK